MFAACLLVVDAAVLIPTFFLNFKADTAHAHVTCVHVDVAPHIYYF